MKIPKSMIVKNKMKNRHSRMSKFHIILIFLGSITTAISGTMFVSAYIVLVDEAENNPPSIYQYNTPGEIDREINRLPFVDS